LRKRGAAGYTAPNSSEKENRLENLRIIVTGGTLDKIHDVQTEGLGFAPDGTTHLPELLRTSRCHFPIVELLMLKDSLYFDDADRQAIALAVIRAPERAVVVTHGTGTMGQTARFLAPLIAQAKAGKTVVLTGAMRPYSLQKSDADFNIGGAVVAAQLLGAGVWGVMNGRVFAAEDLVKNTELGRFDQA
jgi:L-asparaginase